MQRKKLAALATATLTGAALMLPLAATQATAEPDRAADRTAAAPDRDVHDHGAGDNLLQPWQRKYEAIRQAGVEKRLRSGSSAKVQKLAKGQFAQTGVTGNDRVFVILAEFGDTTHSAYPDGESDAQEFDGPLHNQIPKPDRSEDNSTLWQPDYDRAHYENMYFNRLDKFFNAQSGGKYGINGEVTEWVKVPFNEARYGRDDCGDITCSNTWFLLRDGLAQWTQDRLDEGMTMQEVQAYLKTFDQLDRYDFDDDGDFTEPDGYIDHMQIVHAGRDQSDGDPAYGSDAIWAHRWYAQINPRFTSGPDGGAQLGGINIGEGGPSDGGAVQIPDNPTGVWVGDYTIQPENGGLSVFAHEYTHDLGLPDLYDTSGNTGGAENSTRWWSLMSQSRGTNPGDPGIGDRPMPLGAWDKFQLGWLDAAIVNPHKSRTVKLRPGQTQGKNPNGIVVRLPDKKIRQNLGAPCDECGDRYFYSGKGNEIDHNMKRAVDGGGELTAKVKYEIEDGWDYAFLEVSNDNGASWTQVETSESYDGADQSGYDPNDVGISGTTGGEWVDLTATLPEDTNMIRWRYLTDGAFVLDGFQVDNITLDGVTIGDAETQDEGWTYRGFVNTGGNDLVPYTNAYFVDNRSLHKGLDLPLSHLYNFGFSSLPDKVEYFHYNPGALITYWDSSYTDNNVGDHPGHGEVLPVDVHPSFVHTPDGALLRPGFASYDAALSDRPSKKQVIHFQGQKLTLPARKAVRVFDDTRRYWSDSDQHGAGEHAGHYQPGWYSVDVPRTGTTIRVLKRNKKGVMWIKVN
jgi:immune inhibitor A